jgi:hypothetical protein
MSKHRGGYKKWCNDNNNGYTSSYEILQYDDAYIELIEECPCENAAQLCKKEGEYIRLHRDNCVNIQIPGRPRQETRKAYYEVYKEEQVAKSKAYREAHKEEISAKQKAYHEAHKEERNAKHKAWREAHKEERNAKQKAYHEAHKEQRKASREANRERENQLQRERHAKAKAAKADAP